MFSYHITVREFEDALGKLFRELLSQYTHEQGVALPRAVAPLPDSDPLAVDQARPESEG